MSLGEKAEATADRVSRTSTAKAIGRFGLVARGIVYCIVGGLAARVANGEFDRADNRGALETVARQPSGWVMLVVLAIGFVAFAASNFLKAAAGSAEGGTQRTGVDGTAKRGLDVGKGVIYLGLAGSTLAIAHKGSRSGSGGEAEKEWTAELLRHSYGQFLAELVGVAIIGIGLYLLYRGLSQSFEENLRMEEMPPWARRPASALGTAGYAARGVIFALIGVFVFIAAVGFDPEESVGVDGALKKLAGQPYGPAMLILVALGLFSFGLFSFVEARYRKVLQA